MSNGTSQALSSPQAEVRPFNLTRFLLLVLIGASIFLLPYMRLPYYDQLLGYVKITPLQFGTVLAIYGVCSTVGTFFSGVLADRYPAKWLLVISLLATGAGGLLVLSQPGYYGFIGIYMLWGLSITFTYNSAHYKAIRYTGSAQAQGKLYGSVGGFRKITSALIAFGGAAIFGYFSAESTETGFVGVLCFYTSVYFVVALLVIVLWKKEAEPVREEEKWKISDSISVLKHPATWYLGFIIYFVYAIGRCMDLVTPYMSRVLEIDPETNVYLNTIRGQVVTFVAGIALGVILDRTKHKIKICQLLMALTAITLVAGSLIPASTEFFWQIAFFVIICLATTIYYGAYLTAFSLLELANIPKKITGSIIGVAISIGFLPDITINFLTNYFADSYGFELGNKYMLLFGAAHAVVAIFLYSLFNRYLSKINKPL